MRFICAYSSVVRQMPGYNPQRRGTARTLPKSLCCPTYFLFCVILYIVCVLYYCHRVATQLQLTNISYHSISKIKIVLTTSISFTRWPFKWQYPVCNSIITVSLFLLKLSNLPDLLPEGYIKKVLYLPLLVNGQPMLMLILVQSQISPLACMPRTGSDPVRACQ